MAEFCEKCLEKDMGITKDNFPDLSDKEFDLLRSAWLVEPGYICESCGYKYLDNPVGNRNNED